jgi:hypothetical protein
MQAKQLIENASYGPDALKIVCQAFDEAWADISGNFGDDPQTIETARLKLAKAILTFPYDEVTDVQQIKKSALRVMALLYSVRTAADLTSR